MNALLTMIDNSFGQYLTIIDSDIDNVTCSAANTAIPAELAGRMGRGIGSLATQDSINVNNSRKPWRGLPRVYAKRKHARL
jgi:hypothetical protein